MNMTPSMVARYRGLVLTIVFAVACLSSGSLLVALDTTKLPETVDATAILLASKAVASTVSGSLVVSKATRRLPELRQATANTMVSTRPRYRATIDGVIFIDT